MDTLWIFYLLRIIAQSREWETAMSKSLLTFEEHFALAFDIGADPTARIDSAVFLAGEGLFREVKPVAEALKDRADTALAAGRLLLTIRQFERWGLHDRLTPWVDEGVDQPDPAMLTRSAMFLRRSDAHDAIIVFIGTADLYWVTLYLLERFLPKDRHILFLKDPTKLRYAFGTPAFGPNHGDITSGLRRFLEKQKVRRFHVLGTSSGGFAALHFAITARAQGALALSPETTLVPFAERSLTQFTEEVKALLKPRMPLPLDLQELFKTYPVPEGVPILLMYAELHAEDAAMCKRMAGLVGVQLEAVPDCDLHDLLSVLIAQRRIAPLFSRVFGAADQIPGAFPPEPHSF